MTILAYFGFFVLAFFFVILVLGLSLISTLFGGIRNILRLFGIGGIHKESMFYGRNEDGRGASNNQRASYKSDSQHHTSQQHNSASTGKIFGRDEGEYVEFEEIV